MEEYLLSLGLKVWEKKDSEGNTTVKRIYINDLKVVGLEKHTNNPKAFKFTMYYDCLNDVFNSNVAGRSDVDMFQTICKSLREEAKEHTVVEEENVVEETVKEEIKETEIKEEKSTEELETEEEFINANLDRFLNDEEITWNGARYMANKEHEFIIRFISGESRKKVYIF